MQRRTIIAILTAFATLVPSLTATALTPVEVPDAPPEVIVKGTGGGHGVGMSQYGAYGLARQGKSAAQIVSHYYTGASLTSSSTNTGSVRVGLGLGYSSVPISIKTSGEPVSWRACGSTCVPFTPPEGDNSVDPSWFPEGVTKLALDHGDVGAVVTAPHPYGASPRRYRYGYLVFRLTSGKIDLISVQPNLETYLRGLAEVPSSWGNNGGQASLEAQAITGRTYALGRLGSVSSTCDCHLTATPTHQFWVGYDKETGLWGEKWVQAVDSTSGLVATVDGKRIETFYSASHGGRSENVEDSWAYGSTPIPYLRSVSDAAALDPALKNPYATPWTRTSKNADFAALLGSKWKRVARIRVQDRTAGGTPRTLLVEAIDANGVRTEFTWGGPTKNIAGASMRNHGTWSGASIGAYPGYKLPSSQISHISLAPFTDDDGTAHEYENALLKAAGLTVGCNANEGGDRYCPDRLLTRAEMATFLVRGFEELVPVPGESRFSDTPVGATHTDAITALRDAGLTNGCGGGRYCPDRPLTRAEMATFLVRVVDGIDPVPGETRFSDVKVGQTHADAITAIADAGLTNGCGGGKFCPDRPVTRGEMASFLIRALTWRPPS